MKHKIELLVKNIIKVLKPFKPILWFLFLFLFFDFLWKLSVKIGDSEEILLVWGHDLTQYTKGFCLWTAKASHWMMYSVFGYTNFKIDGANIFFENSLPVAVVWTCTGIKQLVMFSFILLFYFGPIKKKLWYIPLSIIILMLVNILRISIICIIIKDGYPDWFISFNEWYNGRTWENTEEMYWLFYRDWYNVFHRDIFTWIYYDGIIFLLWLLWEEKIRKRYRKLHHNK